MILNREEVVKALMDIKSYIAWLSHLSKEKIGSEKLQTLDLVAKYFATEQNVLTSDEFNELFECSCAPISNEEVEIKVKPRRRILLYADDRIKTYYKNKDIAILIDPNIEEHLRTMAYASFRKQVEQLRTKP